MSDVLDHQRGGPCPLVHRAAVGAAGLADADLPSDRLAVAESIELPLAREAVPDPRRRRRRRHGLQSILLLAVDAVLAGARSYAAIADWAAHADHAVTLAGRRRTQPRSAACWARSTPTRWSRCSPAGC